MTVDVWVCVAVGCVALVVGFLICALAGVDDLPFEFKGRCPKCNEPVTLERLQREAKP